MGIHIISDIVDYHAAAVRWACETVGFEIHQWEGLGYEEARQASIEVVPQIRILVGNVVIAPNATVWMRRPLPFSLSPHMSTIDHRFARGEAGRFSECLWDAMEISGCRLINPPSAAWAINKKLRQLVVASGAGMRIPRTVMGNQVKQINQFRRMETGQQIYKGFLPHLWENHETGATAFAQTAEMPGPDDSMEQTLTYAPGIYQQRIMKTSDVRVMVMGDLIRAFMIHSKSLDWRIDAAYGRAYAEETLVPSEIVNGIKRFMSAAGIVFGCLDFAVDDAGEWCFLEINESGQFLWIDDMLPDAGVLQDFLAFLTGADREIFPAHRDFRFDYSTVPERVRERPGQVTVEC